MLRDQTSATRNDVDHGYLSITISETCQGTRFGVTVSEESNLGLQPRGKRVHHRPEGTNR